ncbi:peptidylprolyl isomerase [uncultured Muribaculum sp.]|uniref:peptidylprolyl isomerase n=2 Tax=uncultured Muribaculum sp. TaxID=1918613 RepID=UPI00266EFA3C|nr:peptidylprolyl isomerase [uncultured Muribaculum sp.]
MKKIALLALSVATIATAGAKKTSDPVLLTVGKQPVTVSEFKYLYEKNRTQQPDSLSPQSYMDMFVNYKLKVADARANGIDTTEAFRKEFDKYKLDLFKPYLENREGLDSLIKDEYERMHYEVDANHIMIYKGRTSSQKAAALQFADSLRQAILNGADYAEVARKHSFDQNSAPNGGHLGYMSGGQVPYKFEEAAFSLPIGQISEVVETPFAYHIIRVDNRRPAKGQVLTRHILKLTQGKTPEEQAAAKNAIDSLYKLAIAPETSFEALAKAESDDPGSAQKGGMLPWFGAGMMVPEFENAAFSLNDSAISEPFQTSYGYHIVQRLGHREIAPYEEASKKIVMRISRDDRRFIPRQKKFEQLRKQYGVDTYQTNIDGLKQAIDKATRLDTTLAAIFVKYPSPFAKVGGNKVITSADVFANINLSAPVQADEAKALVDQTLSSLIDNELCNLEIDRLEASDPEFRNILREYHDGMMLFDISNRRVWEAASSDKEGLDKYFQENKSKYKFDQPRFKGVIVHALNDSLAKSAEAYTKSHKIGLDSLGRTLREKIGKGLRVEKVLVKKGDNPRVDNTIWGVPYKSGAKSSWPNWFIFEGRIIDGPEEVADVRAQVITDYQQELERQWLQELKAKYPVKVNKRQLKNL